MDHNVIGMFPEPRVVHYLMDNPGLIDQYLRAAPKEWFDNTWLTGLLGEALLFGNEERVRYMLDRGGSSLLEGRYPGEPFPLDRCVYFFDPFLGGTIHPSNTMVELITPYFTAGLRSSAFMHTTLAGKHFLLDVWPPILKSPLDVSSLLRSVDRTTSEYKELFHRLVTLLPEQNV